MIKWRIQRVCDSEWHNLRDVRLRALADAPDAFGATLAEEHGLKDADWIARAVDPDVAQFLAISSGGDAVGIVVGAPFDGIENAAGLFSMWVDSEFRGCGVGSALVDAVVGWARDKRYDCVVLDVADANTAAVRLYESRGFLPTGKTGTLPAPRDHIVEHQRSLSLE